MNTEHKETNPKELEPDFHGAALIDENGNEIPITENMVQKACSVPEDDTENTKAKSLSPEDKPQN